MGDRGATSRGGRQSARALAIIFALVLPGSAAEPDSLEHPWEEREVVLGQQRCAPPEHARVTVRAERDLYLVGDAIFLRFCVHNDGDEPFEIQPDGFGTGYRASAKRTDGVASEVPTREGVIRCGEIEARSPITPASPWCEWVTLAEYLGPMEAGPWELELWNDLGWTDATTEELGDVGVSTEGGPHLCREEIPEGVAPTRTIPRARTQIELLPATEENARRVLASMTELPTGNGDPNWLSHDRDVPPPVANHGSLAQAVYARPLLERIEAGETRAGAGLRHHCAEPRISELRAPCEHQAIADGG